jgi:O-methyltransferase involved in polyketide biosynthesis
MRMPMDTPVLPNLTGVPETMPWTLHNRASEALRPDAWLRDEHAIRIYRALNYDHHFIDSKRRRRA